MNLHACDWTENRTHAAPQYAAMAAGRHFPLGGTRRAAHFLDRTACA